MPARRKAVTTGLIVYLDGNASSDPEWRSADFSWTLTVKPPGSTAMLSAPTTVAPTFVADLDGAVHASAWWSTTAP